MPILPGHVILAVLGQQKLVSEQATTARSINDFGENDCAVLALLAEQVLFESHPVAGAEHQAPPPRRWVHWSANHDNTFAAFSPAVSRLGFQPFDRRESCSAGRDCQSTDCTAA